MKIRVCIITSVHKIFDIRIFHKECRTLVQKGYDVTLIAQHDKSEVVDDIKIVPFHSPRNRLERMTKTVWEVYRKAVQVNADIFHFHDPELIPMGLLLKLNGKKVIYDMHEHVPKQIQDKYWIKQRYRNVVSKLFLMAERFLLFNMPIIFAENSYRDDYLWVKNHTTILNMPIIDQLSALRMNVRTFGEASVGYIGTVTAERGSLITIEALKILNDRNVKIRFECVGSIDKLHKDQLLNLCKEYSLSDVKFHGYLPVHAGWSIIGRCHAGLSILLPTPNSTESYPTKIFEYMAMGIPVISSNFPLYQSVIEKEKCGICVSPLNPEEIAAAIIWVLQNPSQAAEMGRNGRKAVIEKYNWEAESRKLISFYEQIDVV